MAPRAAQHKTELKRRTVLKGMAGAGLAGATGTLFACAAPSNQRSSSGDTGTSAPPETETVTVYRFQTRKSHNCKSCRSHQHYKVFVDEATADQHRAHPGCNCRIVPQVVTQTYWEAIAAHEQGGMVDLRATLG